MNTSAGERIQSDILMYWKLAVMRLFYIMGWRIYFEVSFSQPKAFIGE
jgi:hypothetical protein